MDVQSLVYADMPANCGKASGKRLDRETSGNNAASAASAYHPDQIRLQRLHGYGEGLHTIINARDPRSWIHSTAREKLAKINAPDAERNALHLAAESLLFADLEGIAPAEIEQSRREFQHLTGKAIAYEHYSRPRLRSLCGLKRESELVRRFLHNFGSRPVDRAFASLDRRLQGPQERDPSERAYTMATKAILGKTQKAKRWPHYQPAYNPFEAGDTLN